MINTKENGRYVNKLVEVHKYIIGIYEVINALTMKMKPSEMFAMSVVTYTSEEHSAHIFCVQQSRSIFPQV